MNKLVLLVPIFFLFSCAKTEEQQIVSAKKEALYYLTHNKCSKAREALDSVDFQSSDAVYVSLYSDTYACEAGYGQLTTAIEGMSNLQANTSSLFQTLATFPSSQGQASADETSYTKLMQAIQTILNSGDGSAARIVKFGATKAGDLHLQLLLLVTVQMGKYFGYYGDVDSTGTKGASGNWKCLAEYTDSTALNTHLAVNNGDSCSNADNSASSEMQTSDADYERRLCEGIILFNNFQDILSNISFSDNSSELGQLTQVGSVLNTIETTAAGLEPGVSDYKDILDQTECETTAQTKAAELQRYYALVIENSHN